MTWREHIQEAIDHTDGKWTLADIEERLMASTAWLFTAGESCAVVWLELFPQKRVLVVAFGGGVLEDFLDNIPPMADYARQLECDQIDVYGRPGWARVLKQHGFRQTAVIMSREV